MRIRPTEYGRGPRHLFCSCSLETRARKYLIGHSVPHA
jgi:hypothetical protein